MVMVTVAVTMPAVFGRKLSWKGMLLLGKIIRSGRTVTRKAAALTPPTPTNGSPLSVRAPNPVLLMVKVRVTLAPLFTFTLPKIVPLAALGVAAPLLMRTPFPVTTRNALRPNFWMRLLPVSAT